ncbi:putative alpha/beta hydrolase family esterase [Erwinia toletana]|uniref:Alpha/beta hydrolase family esterase n=1 Tax=Winslowiella toletana TaxID=92490 RepID=A0ABS4PDV5_9GAMM|nr:alpha/beta hydrolase [Winslowiella toletana]MBP2170814.1 putative alpha/beta hydrolase family esterase [Winslowiella toletana]
MKTTYLLVPGYTNSGPEHWQSYLERKYTNVTRVVQDDWHHPCRQAWTERLNSAIAHTAGDIVLLGHSCGAVTVAQWAASCSSEKVKAAVMVAPADVDAQTALQEIQQQRPLPDGNIPLASLLICSDNDEHLSLIRAHKLASVWGSEIEVIPGAGHIHTAAGYGEWLAGEQLIESFTGRRFITKASGNLPI